jgi:hypothetical protein
LILAWINWADFDAIKIARKTGENGREGKNGEREENQEFHFK